MKTEKREGHQRFVGFLWANFMCAFTRLSGEGEWRMQFYKKVQQPLCCLPGATSRAAITHRPRPSTTSSLITPAASTVLLSIVKRVQATSSERKIIGFSLTSAAEPFSPSFFTKITCRGGHHHVSDSASKRAWPVQKNPCEWLYK